MSNFLLSFLSRMQKYEKFFNCCGRNIISGEFLLIKIQKNLFINFNTKLSLISKLTSCVIIIKVQNETSQIIVPKTRNMQLRV